MYNLRNGYKHILITTFIVLLSFCIYFPTRITGSTHFDYFTRLAESFLQGNLYVVENPPHLNELIKNPYGPGYYVVYPPMPAIVAMPFVFFDVADKSQTFISIVFASLNVGLLYIVSRNIFNVRVGIILAVLLGFGTNHWYLATEGSSWYIAHILAVFFILCALLTLKIEQHENKIITTKSNARWLFAGLFLGAAYWSRLPAILITPFFGYLWFENFVQADSKNILARSLQYKNQLLLIVIGVSVFILLNFGYNLARFQTISDKAYELIPGVLDEPWFDKGIFSLDYLPKNINFILLKSPSPHEQFPYYKPSLEGMSLFLTSPFLLLLPFVKWRKKWVLAAIATALFMLIPALTHGTPGFAQFGYRFAMEATPLLFLALGTFLERKTWPLVIPLALLAIGINYWGIYFIRTLGIYGW